MKIKEIRPHIFVREDGSFFSDDGTAIYIYADSLDRYIVVEFYRKKYLAHRLVAEAFCDNVYDMPIDDLVVDHIDGDTKNNHYTNLEWVTQQENVKRALGNKPSNNAKKTDLYYQGRLIQTFPSKTEACAYASQHYGISSSALKKYNKVGDYNIVAHVKDAKPVPSDKSDSNHNVNGMICGLYVDGKLHDTFTSIKSAAIFGSNNFNVSYSGLRRNKKSKNVEIRLT